MVFGTLGVYLLLKTSQKIPAGRSGEDSRISRIREKIRRIFGI